MADSSLNCWKCDQSFATTRERKNHMANKVHSCLRVICPLCPREKLFRRSTPELRDHVKKEHADAIMEKNFFTEANGFWMAIHPKDYRRLVTPSEKKSPNASRARELIRRSTRVQKNSTRSIKDWEAGWYLEDSRKRSRSASTTCESRFLPDYEPPSKATYDPQEPQMFDILRVYAVELKEGGTFEAMFTDEEHLIFYSVVISTNITDNPRDMQSLLRKMAVNQKQSLDLPFKLMTVASPNPDLLQRAAELLAISPKYITQIKKGYAVVPASALTLAPPTCPKESKEHQGLPGGSDPVPETIVQAVEEVPVEEGAGTNSSTLTPPFDEGLHETEGEISIAAAPVELEDGVDLIVKLPPEPHCSIPSRNNIQLVGNLPTNLNSSHSPVNIMGSSSEPEMDDDHESLAESMNIPMINNCSEEKKLIINFLGKGVLPLLPPAKREWSAVQPIELVPGDNPLFWPPRNWEELSPDAKLFAWEMAAFRLHAHGRQTTKDDFNRAAILTKYNMLSLAGTALPKITEEDHDKYRMQNSNFRMLKKLLSSNQSSSEDRTVLRMVQSASSHRMTATDWLTEKLDSLNVRLRIHK